MRKHHFSGWMWKSLWNVTHLTFSKLELPTFGSAKSSSLPASSPCSPFLFRTECAELDSLSLLVHDTFSLLIHTWPTFVYLVIFNSYFFINGNWAVSRILLLCLPLLIIFPSRAQIPSARWQGAVDHTPRLRVPPLGMWCYDFLYISSWTLQSFCHLSGVLLLYDMEHRDFGWISLSLTCGRINVWKWTKH